MAGRLTGRLRFSKYARIPGAGTGAVLVTMEKDFEQGGGGLEQSTQQQAVEVLASGFCKHAPYILVSAVQYWPAPVARQ